MNSLSLSKDQKDHLIEMCNKLFPEYMFEFIRGADVYGYTIYDLFTFCLIKDYENCEYEKSRKYIHWFEFCILLVFPKLLNFYDADKLSDFYYVTIGYKFKSEGNNAWNFERFKHPVDYLYEKFLELNKTK